MTKSERQQLDRMRRRVAIARINTRRFDEMNKRRMKWIRYAKTALHRAHMVALIPKRDRIARLKYALVRLAAQDPRDSCSWYYTWRPHDGGMVYADPEAARLMEEARDKNGRASA